jgi:hypothetical protein
MPSFIDLTGREFDRLTVISQAPNRANGRVMWNCKCICGSMVTVTSKSLTRHAGRSCGCLQKQITRARLLKHGVTSNNAFPTTYAIWVNMRQRCTNPRTPGWKNYGGRGITICDRWQDFSNFLADMGERPGKLSIERIDNSAGYSPDNCEWADRKTQARNTRLTPIITVCGRRLPVITACEEFGVKLHTVETRKRTSGISYTEAFLAVLDRKLHPKSPIPASRA